MRAHKNFKLRNLNYLFFVKIYNVLDRRNERYVFKAYALDTELELKEGYSKQELEDAMKGHILAEAKLTGTFAP